MKLIRNTIAAGIAVAAISLGACSSNHSSPGTSGSNGGNPIGSINGNPGQGNLGSVGMHLQIAPGINVFALNWTISNGTNSYPGTVNIGDAQSVEFVAGGIIAGTGYIVTLSGSDSAGDPCTGASAAVTVIAGATSSATVTVTCTSATDSSVAADVGTGAIAVDAGVVLVGQAPFVCPGINSLAISPSEVLPPQTAALSSSTTSFSGGTETVLWTTSCAGANITAPTSLNTVFNCGTESGVLCTVTLTVGLDGNAADGGPTTNQVCTGAYTTMSETINCEVGTVSCFAPTPNLCGTTCTNTQTDVNNCGTCGTVCASGDTCTAGACAAPPLVPCTTAGQTGCVQCQGNASNLCSPTEAALVNLDIANIPITAPGPDPTAGCYTCLVGADCIDDTVSSDTGKECGDLAGNFTGDGGGAGQSQASLCMATLNCMVSGLGASPAESPWTGCANTYLSYCYCGAGAGGASACATAGAATNGECKAQEAAGLYPTANDSTDILKDYTDTAEPSGMANQILKCAISNGCTQCLL